MIETQADALALLLETAKNSCDANRAIAFVEIPNDPEQRFVRVNGDGTNEVVQLTDRPRDTTLYSVNQVAGFVAYAREALGGVPAVYVGTDAVFVVVDDIAPNRRHLDVATCRLLASEQATHLREACGNPLRQRDLVKLIRVRLAGCVDAGEDLVAKLRVLRIGANRETNTKFDHAQTAYGYSADDTITGADGVDIPDAFAVTLPLYADPAITLNVTIRCSLFLDADAGTFEVNVLGGQWERATHSTREAIETLIRANLPAKAATPLFWGTPSNDASTRDASGRSNT